LPPSFSAAGFCSSPCCRVSRGGGRNHHSLRCQASRFADSATLLRPRCNSRNYEPLRGQDGGGVHDFDLHSRSARITPRWIAFLGFACALLLLLSGRYIDWILLVFPLWVLLISIYILIDNFRRSPQIVVTSPGQTSS
jgi:hypothetical protein